MRRWANEIGLSNHALVWFVIQGKRSLTLRQVPHLSVGLRLNADERPHFQTLIHVELARTEEGKQLVTRWFQELDPVGQCRVKEIDEHRLSRVEIRAAFERL